MPIGLGGERAVLVGAAYAPSFARCSSARARRRRRRERELLERAGGHALVRPERARARARRAPDRDPDRGFVGALALARSCGLGGSEAAFLFLAASLRGRRARRRARPARARARATESRRRALRTLRDRRSGGSSRERPLPLRAGRRDRLRRALSPRRARPDGALRRVVLAAAQVLAVALRVGVGRWSDVVGAASGRCVRSASRSPSSWASPRRSRAGRCGCSCRALAVAGGLSMAWNGLSFTPLPSSPALGAAAPRSASSRPCSGIGIAAPVLFALAVSSRLVAGGVRGRGGLPLAGSFALPVRRGE